MPETSKSSGNWANSKALNAFGPRFDAITIKSLGSSRCPAHIDGRVRFLLSPREVRIKVGSQRRAARGDQEERALILPTPADRTRMELRAERSHLADDLLELLRRKYVN